MTGELLQVHGFDTEQIVNSSTGYHSVKLRHIPSAGYIDLVADISSKTGYQYNLNWRNKISTVWSPQSIVGYSYDDADRLEKRSGPDGDLTAVYADQCNAKTCNKPIQLIDERNRVTDYQYHSASGQIVRVTKPAGRNSVRPETRYSYEQKYAWYKDASGNLKKASTPIWLLTRESQCLTGAASGNGCAKANDEVVTTYKYGEQGVANNLFLTSVTVTANGESRTSCYDYDDYGNRIAETTAKGNCP